MILTIGNFVNAGVNKLCHKDFKKYKCSLQEITGNMCDNMKEEYIKNNAEKITKDNLNKSNREQQRQNFQLLLGFNEHDDVFLSKKQSVLNKLLEAFLREEMYQQYSVLGFKIDLYFVKYKLAVEIGEYDYKESDNEKELMRENAIKQKLGCKFIKINPEFKNFSIAVEINQIFEHIKDIKDKEVSELREMINNLNI